MLEAEVPGRRPGDQLRLVVAALAGAAGMDRKMRDDLGPDADAGPATGDGRPEWVGESLLARGT